MTRSIEIEGATTHNLKNVSLSVPKGKLVVFTGVSGSGKSSLVYDTIYTEAQRQLIETFSAFARRRLPKLSRPPVIGIHNIATCIAIDQKRLGRSSRSTVGTATEIYTHLRMLFSRCGRPFIGWSHLFSFNHPDGMCTSCKGLGQRIAVDIKRMIDPTKSVEEGAILHPDYAVGKWYWREIVHTDVVPSDVPLNQLSKRDKKILLWADGVPVEHEFRGQKTRRKFEGVVRKMERLHLEKDSGDWSAVRREAFERFFTTQTCPECAGSRLNEKSRSVKLEGSYTIQDLVSLELTQLDTTLEKLAEEATELPDVVQPIVGGIRSLLRPLIDIGVGYLTLDRAVGTLSGGESQRVKMARQLDCDLVDMIYVMDEPSVGLHPRDISHLIGLLHQLRDKGNTVLVVEHEQAIMRAADWIVELGPGAGEAGGECLFEGTPKQLLRTKTKTAQALKATGTQRSHTRRPWSEVWEFDEIGHNNLRDVSVQVPVGVLTCFTGVAGSGKSSLVEVVVERIEANDDTRVVTIDQKPPGRSSRSTPATYVGAFDIIRKIFAKANDTSHQRFSFNSAGSCKECKGLGFVEMELSFLDDVRMKCKRCHGRRYTDDVLALTWRGRSIHDVLSMTIDDAVDMFREAAATPKSPEAVVASKLEELCRVGVGYLRLGQPLVTLSGGEAQRLKLASELQRKGSVYVMDEPTTGLHPADIDVLLDLMHQLVDTGNTVLVIEHNLDVIASADWLIDLGPEGGRRGGLIVGTGTPEMLAVHPESHTGRYLAEMLPAPQKKTAKKASG